jgi:N-acetylneuraminic acid mutarotase
MRIRIPAVASAVVLLLSAALAVAVPAAATPGTTPSPDTTPTSSYASCPPPKPGQMQCLSVVRPQAAKRMGVQAASPNGFSPADLRSAYNLPASDAAPTVALVDAYHDPTAEADLAVYRAQYGLPPCTIASGCLTQVDQRGGSQWAAVDTGWDGEIALDLEMVSAICPDCHLLLVEADTATGNDLFAAEDEAIALGARFISNSWGGSETVDEAQAEDPHFDHPGVVITAATGDQGFPGSYPAVSQYVTAVGGTSLYRDPSTARGWSESAWRLAGSACSPFEPAPSFQTQALTDCTMRATADVSAVADPATGVAVYNGGWQVFGGTSVASPIIAATYALAGTPLSGSQPNALPYQHTDAFNDVTTGGGNWCSFKFCGVAPGWDGETGLGTPNGLAGFSPGPHGELAGTVTDQATHQPVTGATVSAGGQQVTTGPHGEYALTLPPGNYTLTVAKFGYDNSATDLQLTDGQDRTANVRLAPLPRATVSGAVRDDSGQGWGVYASVQVHGQPSTRTFTDPATGAYRLSLPQNASYDLDVTPVYRGYQTVTQSVAVGQTAVRADVGDPVDFASCSSALGYAYQSTPVSTETFDGTSAPPGWTTVNAFNRALLWRFDDPGARSNLTGGTGGFAIVDSDYANQGFYQDTSLVSPAWDLSGLAHPALSFHNDYFGGSVFPVTVEVSTDGQNWTSVWRHSTDSIRGPDLETIDLSPWAGQSAVQVRFRYTGYVQWWWEIDDVTLSDRTCAPQPGGLVQGEVTDKNTGSGLTGASVTGGPIATTTVATPDDPAQPEGLYWAFAAPGQYSLAASQPGGYQVATRSVTVSSGAVATADFALPAGRLAVTPGDLTTDVTLGGTATKSFTVRNTGTAPVQVAMHDVPGGATPMSVGPGAPTQLIRGTFKAGPAARTVTPSTANYAISPQAAPWATVADYPIAVVDNAMAAGDGGAIYSAGGFSNNGAILARAYRYDPDAAAWTRLPDMSVTRDYPQAAFLDGKLYVAGGFATDTDLTASMEVYDPATNTWSDGPDMPTAVAAAGVAVLDDRMYVVGGCVGANNCGTDTVQVFDPVTSKWQTAASYPKPVNLEGCGSISGRLYCAGGTSDRYGPSRDGWAYDPATDHWSQIAGMPDGNQFAAAYSAADGRLLMVGGVIDGGGLITNQGWAYDPASNTWSSLPNANTVAWRAAGACGFYKVGGAGLTALANAEILPGYSDCATAADVSWLTFAPSDGQLLQPGAQVTITVTLSTAPLTQPGVYQAALSLSEDTPYPYSTVPITMTVDPPGSWGKLAGTITGTTCTGATVPLAGAAVSITGQRQTFTLKTAADGTYQLWLDATNSPLDIVASKDGWAPSGASNVRLAKGKTTTADITLSPSPPC